MAKPKTLADYITSGRHEFVAFIRDEMSLHDGSSSRRGNNLGRILFGVLVCDKTDPTAKNDRGEPFARIVYKSPPIYAQDSDIMFEDFTYDSAKVVSEVPLALSVSSFFQGMHFDSGSKEFQEARELLKKYGIY
jgi:hypothetical protein